MNFPSVIDTFKIVDSNWFYLLDGDYQLLFNKEKFEKKEISKRYYHKFQDPWDSMMVGRYVAYEPLYETIYNGRVVWAYYHYGAGSRPNFSRANIVFFDPEFGIVKETVMECGSAEMKILILSA